MVVSQYFVDLVTKEKMLFLHYVCIYLFMCARASMLASGVT